MGSVHSINAATELERFFDYLYGEQNGFAYSPLKIQDEPELQQHFFEWPKEKERLVAHVIENSAVFEVYTSPALFSSRDAKKESFKGTYCVWAEFDGEIPNELPESIPPPNLRLQSSVSGHEHWYWRLDGFVESGEVVENISQRLAYTLQADLSCWNSNRVLRPPTSTHHESGNAVTVLQWDSLTTSIASFVDLPQLPVKMLGSTDINFVPDPLDVIFKYPFTTEETEFFRSKEIKSGGGKGRSAALAKLGHICMEKGMTNAEALSLLMNADDRWGKYKHRKDRKERLLGIINYCRSKHPELATKTEDEKEAESLFRVYNYIEFMESEFKLEWAVEGLIHRKGFVSLSGPPGTGKSIFSIRLAEKLARAEKFLRWSTPKPLKTLLVSMEMNADELKEFYESMQIEKSDLLRENMLILPLGSSIGLTNKHSQHLLNNVMEEYQPDGVILDSWGVAVGENLNSETTTFSALNYIHRTLRNEYGAFVWAITHPRKGQPMNKKPNSLDDLFGSQYFGAAVSGAVSLWREGNEFDVTCLKMRMGPAFSPFRVRRTPLLDYELIHSGSTTTSISTETKSDAPILQGFMDF